MRLVVTQPRSWPSQDGLNTHNHPNITPILANSLVRQMQTAYRLPARLHIPALFHSYLTPPNLPRRPLRWTPFIPANLVVMVVMLVVMRFRAR